MSKPALENAIAAGAMSGGSTNIVLHLLAVARKLGTVAWPDGADLDPLVLHGDFEPTSRLVHRRATAEAPQDRHRRLAVGMSIYRLLRRSSVGKRRAVIVGLVAAPATYVTCALAYVLIASVA